MRHAAHLSILSLILALGACTVTDSPETGEEASLPAALEGGWEERLPPGVFFAGSRLVFDFSADTGFLTVHNWTDVVHCHPAEGPPVCSDPSWDHVYAITARAAGDTLDLDARFLRTMTPQPGNGGVRESGRMVFLMDFQVDPGTGDTTLVLDRVDGSAFLPGRRRVVLARPSAAVRASAGLDRHRRPGAGTGTDTEQAELPGMQAMEGRVSHPLPQAARLPTSRVIRAPSSGA